ncbi:MAG: hypothetical protein ABI132_11880 [Rhodanobacteraceae bacterium]
MDEPQFFGSTIHYLDVERYQRALHNRSPSPPLKEVDVYKFPVGLGCLMVFCSILFLTAPFWPGARGNMDLLTFSLPFLGFAAFAFFMGIYFFRYRVVLNRETLTIGAFFKKVTKISDIAEVRFQRENRTNQLIVLLRNGCKITFSGMLGDFQSLVSTLSTYGMRNPA